jgi:hypothetical protein
MHAARPQKAGAPMSIHNDVTLRESLRAIVLNDGDR